MSKEFEKAQLYQENAVSSESEDEKSLRPKFHFSSPVGWCNDPNGFSYFDGKIHLFFQYHPYSTLWGPMHWGHVTTKNLLTWNLERVAFAPDSPADCAGCFSGTAIEKNQKHVIAYTGVSKKDGKDVQNQCIAFGDGVNYTKSPKNPVITAENIPFEYQTEHFRDPKIFEKDGKIFMLCVLKQKNDCGALVLFKANDDSLENWSFVSKIDESKDGLSKMWECPDYFSLDSKDVLILSPQEMKEDFWLGFHDGNNSVYITGKLDSDSKKFIRENRIENNYTAAQIDYGLDFYAPQTTLLPDGRRILIAWMQSWESYHTPKNYKWSGMMCLPRELKLLNGRLMQFPVKEIEALHKNQKSFSVKPKTSGIFESKDNRHFDAELNFCAKKGDLILHLAEGKDENGNFYFAELKYNANKKELSFSRKNTICPGEIFERSVKIDTDSRGFVNFRCIVDTCSVEIFVDNGRIVFTNTFFAPPEYKTLFYSSTLDSEVFGQFYNL